LTAALTHGGGWGDDRAGYYGGYYGAGYGGGYYGY
jgi:hypothetical protein